MAILLLESIHPSALAILEERRDVHRAADRREALSAVAADDVEAIVTGGKQRIDAELMDAAGPAMRVVARCGAGLDTIDLDEARRRDLRVVYAPGVNANATAEHALALMLAAGRQVVDLDRAVREGRWAERDGYQGVELQGARLAVIGLDATGTRLAELGAALGMEASYWSASSRDARFEYGALDAVLAQADVVSLDVALADATRGMIGVERLRLMKPTAILVNTARGALVDEDAVAAAPSPGPAEER